jgi:hypothetical protein
MRGFLLVVLLCANVIFLGSCGSGSTSQTVNITIMPPSSVTVAVGQNHQFSATVTGSSNTGVTWQVNSVTGGNATVGTISISGLYNAPNSVPSPATLTVKAIASADSTKFATASVTITTSGSSTVTVSPNPANVEVFQTQQFSATINGQPSTAVTWQVNAVTGGSTTTGTISTTGLYHAPNAVPTATNSSGDEVAATVSVTAVSPSASGSATVKVFAPNQNAQVPAVKLGTTGGNASDSSTSGQIITCCGGTLGSLVSRGGNQYILSNNHVLARTDLAALGESIIQPGLIDANCGFATTLTVGHLSQFVSLEANNNHPVADAAIAQVVPVQGTVDSSGTILELGGTTSGGLPTDGPPHQGPGITPAQAVASPHNGLVAKSGRTTGLTCSTIMATSVSLSIVYQKGCGTGTTFTATFSNQVSVAGGSAGGNFSAEGDSGSLIVTQDTADPVALLFGGSDVDTVGNPVAAALNALKDSSGNAPTFVGSPSAHAVAACSLPGPQAAMASNLAVQYVAASAEAVQRALSVRDVHATELYAHPEVQALGVGASYDNAAEGAILLFVTSGQPRTSLPATVDGIRTRIIEGDFFARRGILSAEESATLEQSTAPPQAVYSISDAEFNRALPVHAAHADEWMKQPGVQGFGVTSSVDSPGEAALMIYLIRGVAHPVIPPVIDGVRTRVRESSRFRAGFGDAQSQRGCSVPSARKTPPSPAPGSRPQP